MKSINIHIDPTEISEMVVGASDSQINRAISTTLAMMANVFSSTSLSLEILDQIGLYLAAHFSSIGMESSKSAYPIRSERVMDAQITYAVSDTSTASFSSTRYGQIAMSLDTSGKLANSGMKTASLGII